MASNRLLQVFLQQLCEYWKMLLSDCIRSLAFIPNPKLHLAQVSIEDSCTSTGGHPVAMQGGFSLAGDASVKHDGNRVQE